MPADTQNYISDPRIWISLGAFVLSIFALVNTLRNQRIQNRRWDELNAPNVVFTSGDVYAWKKITEEEFHGTKWGYIPAAVGRGAENELKLITRLVAFEDGVPIAGMNPCVTAEALVKDLGRLRKPPAEVTVMRSIRYMLVIKNLGKTDARKCVIRAFIRSTSGVFEKGIESIAPDDLPAGQAMTIAVDRHHPPNSPIPEYEVFKIQSEYLDSNGTRLTRETICHWEYTKNCWGLNIPALLIRGTRPS